MHPVIDIHPILKKLLQIFNIKFNVNLNVIMINVYYPANDSILEDNCADERHYGQKPHKDNNNYLGILGKY